MGWPYNKRVEPVHAWGALTIGAAGIVGIPTILVTLHGTGDHFRWWWPTNWMIVPIAIFLVGLALLAVPLRRSGTGEGEESEVGGEASAGTAVPNVTGRLDVDQVKGDAAAVRAKTIKGGKVIGNARAKKIEPGGKISGIDADHIGLNLGGGIAGI